MAALQSAALGLLYLAIGISRGFRSRPLPHRSWYLVRAPLVFDTERINPPNYVRDPAFMLLGVQLPQSFLCIGWIPKLRREVVSCSRVLASLLPPVKQKKEKEMFSHVFLVERFYNLDGNLPSHPFYYTLGVQNC